MKMNTLRWLVFFHICLWGVGAYAASSVWQVSKGENSVFIGGTIHVLSDADYPLPAAFEHAYSKSPILVFEADMAKMKTPAFQAAMLRAVSYSDGASLKSALPAGVSMSFISRKPSMTIRRFFIWKQFRSNFVLFQIWGKVLKMRLFCIPCGI